jgi:hypothetical protein
MIKFCLNEILGGANEIYFHNLLNQFLSLLTIDSVQGANYMMVVGTVERVVTQSTPILE